jgi:hypothetical protein
MKTYLFTFLLIASCLWQMQATAQTKSVAKPKQPVNTKAGSKVAVTFTSDIVCTLYVNGVKKDLVQVDAPLVIKLSPGVAILKAVDSIDGVEIKKRINIAGGHPEIDFSFQEEIAKRALLQKQHRLDSLRTAFQSSVSPSGNVRQGRAILEEIQQLDSRQVSICGACQGNGSISQTSMCTYCNGQGKSICQECNGQGKTVCSRCNGTGQVECVGCSGSGRCGTCDGNGKVGTITCIMCGGKGTCIYCNGTGKNKCSGAFIKSDCHNTGYVQCIYCDGKGSKECSHCNGTGRQETFTHCSACNGMGMILNP